MRLTLRTLLAYLDDTLEPAQARLIGQKVAESQVAQELIERIKKVTRRRSLASPPVDADHSKLDPNTVAEYLNDVLSADELPEVEQVCLGSDVYLAEVAACHQILTLMLSEPARVPPTARQRMYQLVRGRESIPYRRPPAYNPVVEAPTGDDEDARPTRGPLYVFGGLALSVGLAIAVAMAWPTGANRGRPGDDTVVVLNRPTAAAVVSAAPMTSAAVPTPPVTDTPTAAAPPKTEATPPKTQPADTKPADTTAKKPIDQPPANTPSDKRLEVGRLVSPASVLIARPDGGDKGTWQRVPHDGRVATAVPLISLAGYRSDIKLDNGVVVALWGSLPQQTEVPSFECAATLNAPFGGFAADVTIDRGRVEFGNPRPNKARVRIRIDKETWDLTLAEQSRVLVNVVRQYEPGVRFSKAPGGEPPLVSVGLGVPAGKVTVAILDLEPIDLQAPPGPAILQWNSKKGLLNPQRLDAAPPYWSGELPNRPQAKETAEELRKTLDEFVARVTPEVDVHTALEEFLQRRELMPEVAAVFGLGALGRIDSLVDVLDESQWPARAFAIVALQRWCARAAENDLELYARLRKKNYTETHADQVMELLHYFSEEEARDPATYKALFNYLGSDRPAVRMLAFYHLAQLDQPGIAATKYSPDLEDPERAKAIEAWRKRLTDKKIPPKAPAAPKSP